MRREQHRLGVMGSGTRVRPGEGQPPCRHPGPTRCVFQVFGDTWPFNGIQPVFNVVPSVLSGRQRACNACRSVHNCISRMGCEMPSHNTVTATIDYQYLATAMSRLTDDSASNLEKGTQPKWDFKTETFPDWQIRLRYGQSHMTS